MVIVYSSTARDHQYFLIRNFLHDNVSFLDNNVVSCPHVSSEVAPTGVSGRADRTFVGTFRFGKMSSEMVLKNKSVINQVIKVT